ncbi:MAG: hypothetical protein ACFB15_29075 [Cyclobacteriaceae bacterium]
MRALLLIFGLFVCGKSVSKLNQTSDCWEGRDTVQKIIDQEGVINREPNQVAIVLSSSKKLFPCNLPDSYQSGDSVLFFADQKEIFPNERWEGRPVELTHIELKK